jgi:hypothetical protein
VSAGSGREFQRRTDQLRRRRPAVAGSGSPHEHHQTFRGLLRRPPRGGIVLGTACGSWSPSACMGWRWAMRNLSDRDPLRADPLLAVPADKRDPEGKGRKPRAGLRQSPGGQSTLTAWSLRAAGPPSAIATPRSSWKARPLTGCWSRCFWQPTPRRRKRSCSIWTPPTTRSMPARGSLFFTATMATTAICRCAFFCGRTFVVRAPAVF